MGPQQHNPEQRRSLHIDDTYDACRPQPGTAAPAWAPVWSSTHSLGLNRQHRLTIWRVFHGAILCGAFRHYTGRCRLQTATQARSCVNGGGLPAFSLGGSAGYTDAPPPHLPIGSGPGSQPSVCNVLTAPALHCQQRCLWQTIRVAGSTNQHTCSPCGLSCALLHSQRSTPHAHSAGRAISYQTPQCSQARPPDSCRRAQGLAAYARCQQHGCPGRRCLLLHMVQRQAAFLHFGAVSAALKPIRRPEPTRHR